MQLTNVSQRVALNVERNFTIVRAEIDGRSEIDGGAGIDGEGDDEQEDRQYSFFLNRIPIQLVLFRLRP